MSASHHVTKWVHRATNICKALIYINFLRLFIKGLLHEIFLLNDC
jgi:hypothetical protein